MDSSQIKLQNTEVVVGLVGGHSIARPGDTSKYFTCTTGDSPERVYVDGCTSDVNSLFSAGNIQSYITHAVTGGTSAVFLAGSGISRMGDYDRKQFMADFCTGIGQTMARFDPDLSMTYAFVGLTDSKVVDFHRDRSVNVEKLEHGLADLQHEVEDWEQTEEKILRGATLPFILSLHFESLKGVPTNGHLCLIDLNIANWSMAGGATSDSPVAGEQNGTTAPHGMLQQSTRSLGSLIHLLANDAVITGVTIPSNALVRLVGEFLYGSSKTAFVLYLSTDAGSGDDMRAAIDLIKALRRLKSRELVRAVDRRVLFFYEKAKYYQSEKYRLQDELTEVQDGKEQVEKDLDDIQRDFGEEREALAKEVGHWQAKSQALEATLTALKSESAGVEADARWENARLVTDKLALRDELRRAEIEMAAAEDAKARLLDLCESLQSSHDSLDAVYSELLAAYRALKDAYARLSEANVDLTRRAHDADELADQRATQAAQLRTDAADAAKAHSQRERELEDRLAHASDALDALRTAETQRSADTAARVAQLGAENRELAESQSDAVAGLQAAAAELTARLEDVQRQASAKEAALSASLRAAERQCARLEADKTALAERVECVTADEEAQAELSELRAQWQRERDQLQRQVSRLQQTASNAERREAELREESEAQWNAWENEKSKNHDKYLRLKDRFRQAVEYAADVQVRLDDERERAGPADVVDLSTEPASESPTVPRESAPAAARPKPSKQQPKPRHKAPPKPASKAAVAPEAEPEDEPTPVRRTRARGKEPSYAEPADDIDIDIDVNNDSDDSEITFNIAPAAAPQSPPRAASARPPPPPPKRGTRAPRAKKSAAELSAELHTAPARKRGASRADPIKDLGEVETLTIAEPPAKRPSPKRKQPTASAPVPAPAPAPALVSAPTDAGLKKKRKLNLSRMRSLMGISADKPSSAAASNPQAIKFAVPKIRAVAAPTTTPPAPGADQGTDSD
ncbi:hypothetical protein GGI02_000445 [Coemansia sp. RSA 2322]|nr:hypothetical protein GGI02_000445 [Coemansia sp. RSA 2322]